MEEGPLDREEVYLLGCKLYGNHISIEFIVRWFAKTNVSKVIRQDEQLYEKYTKMHQEAFPKVASAVQCR